MIDTERRPWACHLNMIGVCVKQLFENPEHMFENVSLETLNDPEQAQVNNSVLTRTIDCSGFLLKINYEIAQTLLGLLRAMPRVVQRVI